MNTVNRNLHAVFSLNDLHPRDLAQQIRKHGFVVGVQVHDENERAPGRAGRLVKNSS